jgi:hypothetical protein
MEKCRIRKDRLDRLEDRLGAGDRQTQARIQVIKANTPREVDRAIKRFLAGDKPKDGTKYQTIFIIPAFEETAKVEAQDPALFGPLEKEILEQMPDDERDRLLEDLRRKAAALEGNGNE